MKVMINTIENIGNMYCNFWGVGLYGALFLLAIIYLIIFEKDKNKQKLFLGYTFIFTLLYLFPITAYIIMQYGTGYRGYWRMFWLLPVTGLIAYVLTEIVFYSKGQLKRVLVMVLFLFLIVTQGNNLYKSDNYNKSTNLYQMNQDTIVIADAIEEDAEAMGIAQPGVLMPNAIAVDIRQYDANIRMPYGGDAIRGDKVSPTSKKIFELMNADNLDPASVVYYASQGNYQYLVYPTGLNKDQIVAAGYTLIKDVGNYYIYRMTPDAVPDKSWLITQYGEQTNQMMFYTLQDKQGHLIVVDGGWEYNAENVKKVIRQLGNHVDAWILTHPHEDHMGAFCEVYDKLGNIKIDKVYTVDMASPDLCLANAPWDHVDVYKRFLSLKIPQLQLVHSGDKLSVGDLKINVLSAYEDHVDQLSNELLNDGSMMFKVQGNTQSMLFCADVGRFMSDYLVDKYEDTLKSDYIQMGHHGNGGLKSPFYTIVAPKVAFFDAPDWLFYDSNGNYTTPENRQLMKSLKSTIVSFSTAPNSVILK